MKVKPVIENWSYHICLWVKKIQLIRKPFWYYSGWSEYYISGERCVLKIITNACSGGNVGNFQFAI